MHVRFGEGERETAGREIGAARVLYSTLHPQGPGFRLPDCRVRRRLNANVRRHMNSPTQSK